MEFLPTNNIAAHKLLNLFPIFTALLTLLTNHSYSEKHVLLMAYVVFFYVLDITLTDYEKDTIAMSTQ